MRRLRKARLIALLLVSSWFQFSHGAAGRSQQGTQEKPGAEKTQTTESKPSDYSPERKQPDPPTHYQSPSLRISTQLVQIDATVTDGKGEHVDDLTEDDFVLTLDGKKEKISYFRLVKLPEPTRLAGPATKSSASVAPPPPSSLKTIAPEHVVRTIAFVFDDLGLSSASVNYARRGIKKFLDEQMQEGDLVAIIPTGESLGALQQFTSDKRLLYAAVNKLTWNPFSRDMMPRFGSDDPIARVPQSSFDTSRASLSALSIVVRELRELPGHKCAILISDGFGITDYNLELEQARRLADLANRSHVVIYSLDAKGLQTLHPTTADNINAMSGRDFGERMLGVSRRNFLSQEVLMLLARETGGIAVFDNNDINFGVQKALKDQQSYYLIGFDPENEKFDMKFHSIKLKTRRHGLQTRTQSGFVGLPDNPQEKVLKKREDQLLLDLFSPFVARDVEIQMTSLFFNAPNHSRKQQSDPENISYVRSFFHIGASNLTFEDAGNGGKTLNLVIATFTFNENGAVVEQHEREFGLRFNEAGYRQALTSGFDYTDDFMIKKPGAYQFRAIIRDAKTGRMGSAGQFIQVPDLSKNRLYLSGLVLSTEKKHTGQAPPAEPRDDIPPTPNMRRFLGDSTIDYGAVIYNPTLDPTTGKPKLTLQLEIYHDGKVFQQLEPRNLDTSKMADPMRVDCVGRLKLTSIPAGDYMLHLIVTDQFADRKFSRAEQWMDFGVR
ncbi:MAG: VWA domain-containing protein [Chloracidobacterium sp.]|nr:VWA domain-containing protein [Chloracidobacterium sp.]